MAEIATIARPYAEALFRAAKSTRNGSVTSDNLGSWSELLNEMSEAVGYFAVKEMIKNPKISASVIAEKFGSLLVSPVTQEAKILISILANNHRLLLIPEIAQQFHALKNAYEGSADAMITSAFPLTEDQVSSLCKTLETKFGQKLKPSVTVDTSLIGGVRVAIGDEVLDTSVRAKLQQMQIALTA